MHRCMTYLHTLARALAVSREPWINPRRDLMDNVSMLLSPLPPTAMPSSGLIARPPISSACLRVKRALRRWTMSRQRFVR